ncbi:MAG: endo-1,4-beta-xylanase, partial [Phaeodactylibacter sp.]|nr:endo-1,4-beta-xylanase [Phaeodactylibacter sp.]
MMRSIHILACCLLALGLSAQDAYHNYLLDILQDEYGLPAGSTWVLNDNEQDNLSSDFTYGNLSASNQSVSDQPFSQKVTINVNGAGANPWDAAYGMPNIQSVNSGDAILLVIWLRAEGGGNGQVSLFVENSSTYEKEVFLTFNPAAQWTPYFVPFEAGQNYAASGLTIGLHLAWQEQTIELGGLALVNYHNLVNVDDLPNETNNSQYGGYEADAPWRAEAADRIEQYRKANLIVHVEDADGMPMPGATVEVEMLQHDFAFGSAVVASRFADNPLHSDIYESKLIDFDGEGHGFNWVVFENAMKWPAWEDNWITTPPQTATAVEWLRDHDIQIRGHCLVWPGWSNLPNDMQANANNPNYLKQRAFDHIEAINTYPGIQGNIAEWDVLNEITTNRSLEMALQGTSGYPTGREVYPEIFEKLQEVAPGMKGYVNDYVTISQANTGGGNYDLKKQFIQEIIDAGASVDGIGFQGHIGAYPTSIYDVEAILDDFYDTFGTKAKITEYDTNADMSDELAATYLHDFLTMIFSHPSMNGFIVWGFWDGAHWHNNAPFFYQDWSMKPAAQTFIDLVYHDWWTEDSGLTDANGDYQIRGFKGKYRITIDCGNGEVLTDTVDLTENLWIFKRDGALYTHA